MKDGEHAQSDTADKQAPPPEERQAAPLNEIEHVADHDGTRYKRRDESEHDVADIVGR